MVLKDTLLYLSQNQKMRDFVVHSKLTRGFSRRFVAGETLEDAIQATRQLNQREIQVALDFLGENVSDEQEATEAAQNYIDALKLVKQTGVDANVSIKLTALGLDISQALCDRNLEAILDCARDTSIFVCIDMEGSSYTDVTVETAIRMHRRYEQVGTVIQSYLYRSEKDVERLIDEGVRLRLVKGAYKEPVSVAFQEKKEVDHNYVQLMNMLLARGNFPAIATHDQRIIKAANTFVSEQEIDKRSFEFQMLYGIRRDLQTKLVEAEYNMRVYVPYGSHWYPYLMRRMAERPANLFFIMSNALR
jgi:proline dehydrogenase